MEKIGEGRGREGKGGGIFQYVSLSINQKIPIGLKSTPGIRLNSRNQDGEPFIHLDIF